MRHWIDLIEAMLNETPASTALIQRIAADTPENRKHLAQIEQWKRDIDTEESTGGSYADSVYRVPDVNDKEEWDRHSQMLDYELTRLKQKHQAQAIAAKQERIEGIAIAAQREIEQLAVKDRAKVHKLADRAVKQREAFNKKIRSQAQRQLKG